MKSFIYETPVDSEEDLLARVMAAADVGLPSIGDRVYENMVRWYRVCGEVAGRQSRALLVSGPIKITYSTQQKWESSTYDVRGVLVVAVKLYVFGH